MNTRRNRPLTDFTDMIVTGSGEDIAALTAAARNAGVLVFRSAPRPAGPRDPRMRVVIRLRLHHR